MERLGPRPQTRLPLAETRLSQLELPEIKRANQKMNFNNSSAQQTIQPGLMTDTDAYMYTD